MRWVNVKCKFQLPPEPRHDCKTLPPLYSISQ